LQKIEGEKMKGSAILTSLAAGTAIGVVVESSHYALSAALTATILLACLSIHKDRDIRIYIMLMLALGLCRGMAWGLGGSVVPDWGLAPSLHERLCRAVDGAGFADDGTAALVKALISGDRSGIAPEVKSAFRRSGASHLLALSGMHLGIIYGMVARMFKALGGNPWAKRARCLTTIALAGLYVLATGASASITRAFLFIIMRELSLLSGRNASAVSIFADALAVHVFLSPGSILTPGFQLSYLAMCGVYFLYPRLRDLYPKGKYFSPMEYLWRTASMSISCQVFTAPLAWYHFRSFPQWFLLTNVIAMPLTSVLIISALTAIILGQMGICPDTLLRIVNWEASLLVKALGIISGM